jgi:hypothetical protein
MATHQLTTRPYADDIPLLQELGARRGIIRPGTIVRVVLLENLRTELHAIPPHPNIDTLGRVIVSVTSEQKSQIEEAAQRAGITTGRWIRGMLRQEVVRAG